MTLFARLRGAAALLLSFFILSGLLAAPIATYAQNDKGRDGGKKGQDIPIKVGPPIIKKDKKPPPPPPPPKKKDQSG